MPSPGERHSTTLTFDTMSQESDDDIIFMAENTLGTKAFHDDTASSTSSESSSRSDTLSKLQREAEAANDQKHLAPLDARSTYSFSSKSSMQLAKWRKRSLGDTPRRKLTDADMSLMFTPVSSASASTKPKRNRWEAHQLRQTRAARRKNQGNRKAKDAPAGSDMGLFALLPGEMRNIIYRYAFTPPPAQQPVLIHSSDLICGRGPCVHQRAPTALPGMASSCRQIRDEVMPIYVAENTFRFDAAMVRNRCAGNWVKSLNHYGRFLKKVTLEIQVLTRGMVPGLETKNEMSDIILECPAGRGDGRFEAKYGAAIPMDKVMSSGFMEKIQGLNDGVGAVGQASKLSVILSSEALAELVYMCRK